MNPATALATALVDELAACGVREACLSPGSRSAPLALALLQHPAVRLHVRIDERSASFTGLGLAKVSRRPVVVACTSGSAAANLHPAVVEAHEARVPLLVLTADRPPELRGTGANQTIDQLKLYGSSVRWFCEVGTADPGADQFAYWRSLAARAWAEASGMSGGAPGPVHLNVPFREPLVDPDPGPCRPTYRVGSPVDKVRGPDPADVDWLATAIGSARRPVLVAGDCDLRDPAAVLELAGRQGWPILAEPTSNLRAGPNAISTHHHLLATPGFTDAHPPDLAVVVGKVGLSRAVLALLSGGVPQVLLDRDGAWLDPARAAPRVIRGDPDLTATLLRDVLADGQRGWLDRWREAEAKARHALDDLIDATDEPSEPRTARDVAAVLADGALLVAASSMPIRDLNLTMAPRTGVRVVGNRGASGIDGFVSTAVGAALAHDGPAVALAGDLSLLHDQNGLLVAAGEPRPDLTIVVVNNDGGGIFHLLPQAQLPSGFERLFGTPHGVDLAKVAETAGWAYRRVERAAGLAEAVRESKGLRIVEVRTDRRENAALHKALQAAVSSALGSLAG